MGAGVAGIQPQGLLKFFDGQGVVFFLVITHTYKGVGLGMQWIYP